jgi:hypothetical protein
MLLWVFVALVSSQTGPLKVAAPDFSLVGIEPTLGSVYQERLIGRLASEALVVTTSRDVQQLLGLERQRQLLGCDTTEGSCVAELAGALGVEVVLRGSIAKSESGFIVTLRALRADNGRPLVAPNARVASEAALLDWLDEQASVIAAELLRILRPMPSSPANRWIPAMVGGAMVVAGGVCIGVSAKNYDSLTGNNPPPLDQISPVRLDGERLLPVGITLAAVGAAALAWSVVWNATSPKPVQAVLAPLPGGAVVSVGGRFP